MKTNIKWNKKTKYIFITGGVFSSLGKGLSAASIGCLLNQLGLKITSIKLDPYLNVDPGTMSPYQHGEVYVTKDGMETDLDLGHYERFLNVELTSLSSITAGKIYNKVIKAERDGKYVGKTIQVIPHVTDEIKNSIYQLGNETNSDIVIVEIGGTIGDIESIPFVEAMRQIKYELPDNQAVCIHVVPIIEISPSYEIKTKPLQHSIKELRSFGIEPDLLLVRSNKEISDDIKNKIAITTYVKLKNIFSCVDLDNIHLLPEYLYKQKIHNALAKKLNLKFKSKTLSKKFSDLISAIKNQKTQSLIKIAIVGKYTQLKDAYISIYESLKIASYYQNINLELVWIDAVLKKEQIIEELKKVNGLVIPGGFDNRGIDGKLFAIQYARENKLPFLGICLGMQLACVEFARNVLNLKDANSTEFNPDTKNKILDLIVKNKVQLGGTLRLGNYECSIKSNTLASKIYNKKNIKRRHRHRYEFNNDYLKDFEKAGFIFSGVNKKNNLQEIIEIKNHPFFIATQYHPEFNSTLYQPEVLFVNLIKNAKQYKK
ncbi:CTP synthase [Mycoplasmoides pirum]|uniref:CTP synthase n=1 Tax=Mycoplasmoides pirum TaxID=2122 RepID=UPI000482E65A|nr:CTP synthase [Mycoplasmoides pirum]